MHDSRAAGQPRFSGGGGGGGRELERVFPGVSHGRSTVIGIELSLAHSLSVCLSVCLSARYNGHNRRGSRFSRLFKATNYQCMSLSGMALE